MAAAWSEWCWSQGNSAGPASWGKKLHFNIFDASLKKKTKNNTKTNQPKKKTHQTNKNPNQPTLHPHFFCALDIQARTSWALGSLTSWSVTHYLSWYTGGLVWGPLELRTRPLQLQLQSWTLRTRVVCNGCISPIMRKQFYPSLVPALKLLWWKPGPVCLDKADGMFLMLPSSWCSRIAWMGWWDTGALHHRSLPGSAAWLKPWDLLRVKLESSEKGIMDLVSCVSVIQGWDALLNVLLPSYTKTLVATVSGPSKILRCFM